MLFMVHRQWPIARSWLRLADSRISNDNDHDAKDRMRRLEEVGMAVLTGTRCLYGARWSQESPPLPLAQSLLQPELRASDVGISQPRCTQRRVSHSFIPLFGFSPP